MHIIVNITRFLRSLHRSVISKNAEYTDLTFSPNTVLLSLPGNEVFLLGRNMSIADAVRIAIASGLGIIRKPFALVHQALLCTMTISPSMS